MPKPKHGTVYNEFGMKKLSMVERFFIMTEEACTHCLDSEGLCCCNSCYKFIGQYGQRFNLMLGYCKECIGTGWKLKLSPVPLDENGVPMKTEVIPSEEDA